MKYNAFIIVFILTTFNGIAQSTASENVRIIEVHSAVLDTTRTIRIYLPKSYSESEKEFPVIYMHDAQNLFDKETSFVGEWEIDEFLDSIAAPEAIIVGIDHGNQKRIDELTPYPHEKHGGGNAKRYLDFLVNDLKPFIDSHYKTSKNKQHTGVFGSSLGGLVSFFALYEFPETFGFAGVFSPSFWYSEKIYDLARTKQLDPSVKIAFLAGDSESETMVSELKKMIDILKQKDHPEDHIKMDIIANGEHNEKLWRENFGEAYLWLMQN